MLRQTSFPFPELLMIDLTLMTVLEARGVAGQGALIVSATTAVGKCPAKRKTNDLLQEIIQMPSMLMKRNKAEASTIDFSFCFPLSRETFLGFGP